MIDFFERHRILGKLAKVAFAIFTIILFFLIYDATIDYINNQPEVVTKLENIEIDQKFEDFMFKIQDLKWTKRKAKLRAKFIIVEKQKIKQIMHMLRLKATEF